MMKIIILENYMRVRDLDRKIFYPLYTRKGDQEYAVIIHSKDGFLKSIELYHDRTDVGKLRESESYKDYYSLARAIEKISSKRDDIHIVKSEMDKIKSFIDSLYDEDEW